MERSDYPALYISADHLACKAQQKYLLALVSQGVFLLLVGGAGFLLPDRQVFVFVALMFAAFVGLTVYLMVCRPDQVWYGARAIAESVKTLAWRYVCGAPPFQGDHVAARELFMARLLDLVRSNEFVANRLPAPHTSTSMTSAMSASRGLNLKDKIAIYKKYRIQDQLDWYTKKSKSARREGLWAYSVLVLFCSAGLVICIAGTMLPAFSFGIALLGLIATLCAFMVAWIQAKRYMEISAAYALSAHEISIIADKLLRELKRYDFEEFVAEAENAFSREHTQWAARRDN